MCSKKNFLVIGGGVGPAAGVMFHQKIVDMVDNQGMGDQGHAPVIHLSMSPFVLDRTAFLMGKIKTNPGFNMGLSVLSGCNPYREAVGQFIVGVPCNTFHSDKVYGPYSGILRDPQFSLINMIEETFQFISTKLAGKKVILLSTKGTRDTQVYERYFGDRLIKCNGDASNPPNLGNFFAGDAVNQGAIDRDQQGALMAAIYDPNFGVKGINPNYGKAKAVFEKTIESIINARPADDRNVDDYCVIMGCTEIPIAYEKTDGVRYLGELSRYVDPMTCLAAKMIVSGGYRLKQPFLEQYQYMRRGEGPEAPPAEDQLVRYNAEMALTYFRNMTPRSKL